MKKVKKKEVVNKPKFPLFASLGEIILLILVIAVVSTYVTNNILDVLFTTAISDAIYEILNIIYIIIGVGGSVLILFDNFTGKGLIKKMFGAIGNFYRHPKVHWKQHAVVLTVLVGLIVYSQIVNFNSSGKLCGDNGSIYYCDNGEDVVCDDDLVPVFDNKTYKCVSYNTYRHDYEHEEYDFICTKQYRYLDYNNVGLNDELIESEKSCLYDAITKEADAIVADLKKDLPSTFDIRDKVTIKAGDQGSSNTCALWSETKALEISAQLKGIDYQFLSDFEKQINNIKTHSPVAGDGGDDVCYGDDCIPGKKEYIHTSEFGLTTSDNDTQDVKYFPEFSDNFKDYRNSYILLDSDYKLYNNPNFILNSKEYLILVTKQMIMKYGSSFIISTEYNKYIDPIVGHQMTIIGWDDSKQSWLALNSWGNNWDNTPGNGYLKSNGDGTTWIKYSDKGWSIGNGSIELLGK